MSGTLLITGANGYLGAHCVERCARSFEKEVVAVWHCANDRLLTEPPPHIHYKQCDLSDRAAVEQLMRGWSIDMVLHAAALLPDNRPNHLHRAVLSNILGTANVVECAADMGCTRFVYCSSISVYGAALCPKLGWQEDYKVVPSSIYGWTKHAGEECLRLRSGPGGLTGISLRLAGIHGQGRGGGALFHMVRAALAGQPLIVNNAGHRFQLMFVDDAVAAALLALKISLPESYHCINLASHVFPSMRQMAAHIIESCGSKSVIWIGETDLGGDHVMNTARMSTILGFAPDGVASHLQQICDSLKEATIK